MNPGAVRHLVLRAPNWVGDLVMSTPILAAAAADARFARVTIVLRAHLAPLLADGPLAPRLVALARGDDEVRALRALGADAIALFTNSFGAAWRARRAGIRLRVGLALNGRGLLLSHRVVPPRAGPHRRAAVPTVHLMRDVIGLLGVSVPSLHPRLALGEHAREATRELLARAGLARGARYALCAPGAAFGAAKLWPPEHFAAALDALHERHGLVGVVTGGPGEEGILDAVAGAARRPCLSLARAERDLSGLKALVADARVVLVGDSGPRWVAAAFDVPCVTVLGPNLPELTATSLEWCEVVRRTDLDCMPCMERVCPLGHHACMRGLEPARVVAAAERLLAQKSAQLATGV
jgi:heptosyltransferase-2